MIVLGVDPGYRDSAFVVFNGKEIFSHGIVDNETMLEKMHLLVDDRFSLCDVLVIEQISMGGMIAGAEIFETCFWSGRFAECWAPHRWDRVKRKDVKLHIAGRVHAKDANIRAALIERFGPDKETAIGSKKQQGPLFGIRSHEWAALAVAVTYYDQHAKDGESVRPGITADF